MTGGGGVTGRVGVGVGGMGGVTGCVGVGGMGGVTRRGAPTRLSPRKNIG